MKQRSVRSDFISQPSHSYSRQRTHHRLPVSHGGDQVTACVQTCMSMKHQHFLFLCNLENPDVLMVLDFVQK